MKFATLEMIYKLLKDELERTEDAKRLADEMYYSAVENDADIEKVDFLKRQAGVRFREYVEARRAYEDFMETDFT